MIKAVPHIKRMQAYGGSDLSTPEAAQPISLSQNESLRGPSPKVGAAIERALQDVALYPDPAWEGVRQEIATLWDLDIRNIICGNGSLELIATIARTFGTFGDEILVPRHAYPFFRTATAQVDATLRSVQECNFTVQVDSLLAAQSSKTKILFLANPGNPTGTRISNDEIRRLRAGLNDHVLLVVDEAYAEFSDHIEEPLFDLAKQRNTIVTRTLSKAYGLAGARVGWAYGAPDLLQEIGKLLCPNNVSAFGQAAAQAALEDQTYMKATVALTKNIRERCIAAIRDMGLVVPDSHTNFALIDFKTPDRATDADLFLRRNGVILRRQKVVELPQCLRVTIGTEEQMTRFLNNLSAWAQGRST